MMKRSIVGIVACAVSMLAGTSAFAYQVTGPVLEVTDTKIVVMKGTERFEVARNADTKVTGDPKVCAKVTIKYVMTAATVDVKADEKKDEKP